MCRELNIFLCFVVVAYAGVVSAASRKDCGLSQWPILTVEQQTLLDSRPWNLKKSLNLSRAQQIQLREKFKEALVSEEISNTAGVYSGAWFLKVMPAVDVDLEFSLSLRQALGDDRWRDSLKKIIEVYHYSDVAVDRIFFAIPNVEITEIGREKEELLNDEVRPMRHSLGYTEMLKSLGLQQKVELGSWLHLPVEAYNTSYSTFISTIQNLNLAPGSLIVDMGSGLGRMGLVIGAFFPELNYVGYEYHQFRMEPASESARELGFRTVQFQQADFSSPELALVPGDVFFFYFPNNDPDIINAAVEKIHQVSRVKKVRILSKMKIGLSRGGDSREVIPAWLGPAQNLIVAGRPTGLNLYESQSE